MDLTVFAKPSSMRQTREGSLIGSWICCAKRCHCPKRSFSLVTPHDFVVYSARYHTCHCSIGNNMTTRGQHYVWCHYLKSWIHENGKIYCLRDGKIIQSNPINIMKQRDFYKLIPFTREDVQFFEYWVNNICEPSMRNVNRRTFYTFWKIANANEIIQSTSGMTEEDREFARRTVIELEENLHTGIEVGAIPILDALRQENLRILDDDNPAIAFFRFIGHQHFRTKVMREGVGKVLSTLDPRFDFSRLRHVFCHCFADNMGGSLYADRKRLNVLFLQYFGQFMTVR